MGETFIHGVHAGWLVEDVAQDLINGRLKTTAPEMTLDVVWYHGRYWSLNNRHLHALKIYLRAVQPEWKRREEMASIRCWPLTPGLYLHGRCIVAKFEEALSSRDGGRSLSLRSSSRSQSRPRRVRYSIPP